MLLLVSFTRWLYWCGWIISNPMDSVKIVKIAKISHHSFQHRLVEDLHGIVLSGDLVPHLEDLRQKRQSSCLGSGRTCPRRRRPGGFCGRYEPPHLWEAFRLIAVVSYSSVYLCLLCSWLTARPLQCVASPAEKNSSVAGPSAA